MRALDHLCQIKFQIIAQIIKAKLIIGAIGDITLIGGAALCIWHIAGNTTDRQAEKLINLPHPSGITLCQIVIDGDHMHASARQRIEIDGQRGD